MNPQDERDLGITPSRGVPFILRADEWDDTKFRHAYWPNGMVQKVAMCGYDGPSTWKGEKVTPPNMCPICLALILDRGWKR